MAANYEQAGDTVQLTAPANVITGAGLKVGSIFGVVAASAANGTKVRVHRRGVFELPKLSTDVVTEGLKMYWDDGNSRLTITASTHMMVGHAVEAAGNPSSTVSIVLTPAGS